MRGVRLVEVTLDSQNIVPFKILFYANVHISMPYK